MKANTQQLLKRIVINNNVFAGKPIIRGFRISVEQILKALGSGISQEELLADFPELEPEDFQACLLYAAQLVQQEKIYKVAS